MDEIQILDAASDERTESEDVNPELVEADDLVEEISIDGMCGVY